MCFHFSVDSGGVLLITTALLSQNKLVGPSIGKPIILSLYLNASIRSINCFMAINSELKVDDSTVFCPLEKKTIGDMFKNINIPICYLLVTLQPA